MRNVSFTSVDIEVSINARPSSIGVCDGCASSSSAFLVQTSSTHNEPKPSIVSVHFEFERDISDFIASVANIEHSKLITMSGTLQDDVDANASDVLTAFGVEKALVALEMYLVTIKNFFTGAIKKLIIKHYASYNRQLHYFIFEVVKADDVIKTLYPEGRMADREHVRNSLMQESINGAMPADPLTVGIANEIARLDLLDEQDILDENDLRDVHGDDDDFDMFFGKERAEDDHLVA